MIYRISGRIQDTLREKTGELDRFFTTGPDLLCILDAGAGSYGSTRPVKPCLAVRP